MTIMTNVSKMDIFHTFYWFLPKQMKPVVSFFLHMENKPARCHSLLPDFTEGSRIAKTLLWLENPGNGLCKFVWEHRDFMYLFVHTSPILAKLDPVEVWKLLVVKEKTAQRMHTLYYSAMSSLNDKKTVKHNLHKQLLFSHKIGNCMCKFGRQDTARANFLNTIS